MTPNRVLGVAPKVSTTVLECHMTQWHSIKPTHICMMGLVECHSPVSPRPNGLDGFTLRELVLFVSVQRNGCTLAIVTDQTVWMSIRTAIASSG